MAPRECGQVMAERAAGSVDTIELWSALLLLRARLDRAGLAF